MNRLSPLIVRRAGPSVPTTALAASPSAFHASPNWQESGLDRDDAVELIEQLKLFATGWLGGLVFFGTYLG